MSIPATISPNSDVAIAINSASEKALELLDSANSMGAVAQLRDDWATFVRLVATQRRRSSATLEATTRRIEIRLGEHLARVEGKNVPGEIGPTELYELRLMARYSEVVYEVIDQSTNNSPATRNRCMVAIKAHRTALGELGRYRPRSERRPRTPSQYERDLPKAREREGAALASEVRTRNAKASEVYQRIRQALAALDAMPRVNTRIEDELASSLVEAEALAVQLLRAERQTT